MVDSDPTLPFQSEILNVAHIKSVNAVLQKIFVYFNKNTYFKTLSSLFSTLVLLAQGSITDITDHTWGHNYNF